MADMDFLEDGDEGAFQQPVSRPSNAVERALAQMTERLAGPMFGAQSDEDDTDGPEAACDAAANLSDEDELLFSPTSKLSFLPIPRSDGNDPAPADL